MISITFTPEDGTAGGPVTLEDTLYLFFFRHSARDDRWYLDIHDADDNLLATGIKLVTHMNLLEPFSDPRLPTGELNATRIVGALLPVTDTDLGNSVSIEYMERSELDFLELLGLFFKEPPPPIAVVI